MFGNKKNGNMNTNGNSQGSAINTIVEGTKSEGTITTQTDLRIDGEVEGTVTCGGKLIIGASGRVEGDVNCQNAVIEGAFKGNLTVNDLLDVRDSANISGEIKTNKLLVQNGASFNGTCDMGATMTASYISSDELSA